MWLLTMGVLYRWLTTSLVSGTRTGSKRQNTEFKKTQERKTQDQRERGHPARGLQRTPRGTNGHRQDDTGELGPQAHNVSSESSSTMTPREARSIRQKWLAF